MTHLRHFSLTICLVFKIINTANAHIIKQVDSIIKNPSSLNLK